MNKKVSSRISNSTVRLISQQNDESEFSYGEIARPVEEIEKLFNILKPYAQHTALPRGKLYPRKAHEEGVVWLIESGVVEAYRSHDDLKFWISSGPLIIGINDIFASTNHFYFKIFTTDDTLCMPMSVAVNIIEKHNLWKSVACILASFVRVLFYRDSHLVTKKAYTTIRTKLIEFINNNKTAYTSRSDVVNYLVDTTVLSRSMIYQVLSDLELGGYISSKNERFVALKKIPIKY